MTRFTAIDVACANRNWQCDSGPAALAALLDLSLDGVKPHFMPAYPGHATPARMSRALRGIGIPWALKRQNPPHAAPTRMGDWPWHGLARVQWEGPWTQADAFSCWASKHTCWVGAQRVQHGVDVWDIDLLGSELHRDGWCPSEWWSSTWSRLLTADIPGALGTWYITHLLEVEPPRSAL